MYNTGLVPVKITLDYIRQFVDDLDIYSYYGGTKIKLNVAMSSPFRQDTTPSWSVFRSNGDGVMYKDFSTGESGNVIKFVQTLLSLSYRDTLTRIWKDLILIKKPHKRVVDTDTKSTSNKQIDIKRKNFTKNDDLYWNQFGITRDVLKKFDVAPIECYWVDGELKPTRYTEKNPMYAYKVFSKFKIYKPLEKEKERKWRTNCSNLDVQGWGQLPVSGDTLIITKSLKDVMTLHVLGFTAIAAASENSDIPSIIIDNLKKRFKHIYIFFDNDLPGVKGAERLASKYDLPFFYIDEQLLMWHKIKDASDLVRIQGAEAATELIKKLINEKKEGYKQESQECNTADL